jgi:hypothetical protein
MTTPRRGMIAEYEDPARLVEALRDVRRAGYRELDALTPYPSDAACEALALPRSRIPWITGAGALLGGGLGYLILWWTTVIDYPLNVGGRPPHPWPAFVPITFESAVLLGGVATFFAFFVLCGLPRLHHPLFEVAGIERASVDRWFLVVGASDPRYADDATEALLRGTGARRVERFGTSAPSAPAEDTP